MNRLGPVFRIECGGCVVALLLLIAAARAWAGSPALSPDQQRRVLAGEIVVLDVLPPGASASAQGGTAIALVCASPAAVWDIVTDWPSHTSLYPRVTDIEVVENGPARVRVRYSIGLGVLSFRVYLDKVADAARRRSTWHLAEDKSHTMFSENVGYWQVDDAGVNTQVTHGIATRTIVPAFLTRGSHRDSLVATVQNMRKRAQGNASPCASSTR